MLIIKWYKLGILYFKCWWYKIFVQKWSTAKTLPVIIVSHIICINFFISLRETNLTLLKITNKEIHSQVLIITHILASTNIISVTVCQLAINNCILCLVWHTRSQRQQIRAMNLATWIIISHHSTSIKANDIKKMGIIALIEYQGL